MQSIANSGVPCSKNWEAYYLIWALFQNKSRLVVISKKKILQFKSGWSFIRHITSTHRKQNLTRVEITDR